MACVQAPWPRGINCAWWTLLDKAICCTSVEEIDCANHHMFFGTARARYLLMTICLLCCVLRMFELLQVARRSQLLDM